jgi:hypothetical protein
MEVGRQLNALVTLVLKKEAPKFTEQEVGWSPELVETLRRQEKSLDSVFN